MIDTTSAARVPVNTNGARIRFPFPTEVATIEPRRSIVRLDFEGSEPRIQDASPPSVQMLQPLLLGSASVE